MRSIAVHRDPAQDIPTYSCQGQICRQTRRGGMKGEAQLQGLIDAKDGRPITASFGSNAAFRFDQSIPNAGLHTSSCQASVLCLPITRNLRDLVCIYEIWFVFIRVISSASVH